MYTTSLFTTKHIEGEFSLTSVYTNVLRVDELKYENNKITCNKHIRICIDKDDMVHAYSPIYGEAHVFPFDRTRAYYIKEWDFVLVYDIKTNKFDDITRDGEPLSLFRYIAHYVEPSDLSISSSNEIPRCEVYKLQDKRYLLIRNVTRELYDGNDELAYKEVDNYILDLYTKKCIDIIHQQGKCRFDNTHPHLIIFEGKLNGILYEYSNQVNLTDIKYKYMMIDDDKVVLMDHTGLSYKDVKYRI